MTRNAKWNVAIVGIWLFAAFSMGLAAKSCVNRQPDPPPVIRENSAITFKDCQMTGMVVDWDGSSMSFWVRPVNRGESWRHVTVKVESLPTPPEWAL